MRRTALLAAAIAVMAAPAARASDAPVVRYQVEIAPGVVSAASVSCGGISPLTTSCSGGSITLGSSINMTIAATVPYIGTISMRLTTASGEYTFSCDFVGALPIIPTTCSGGTSGSPSIGELAVCTGTADGVGQWRVECESH